MSKKFHISKIFPNYQLCFQRRVVHFLNSASKFCDTKNLKQYTMRKNYIKILWWKHNTISAHTIYAHIYLVRSTHLIWAKVFKSPGCAHTNFHHPLSTFSRQKVRASKAREKWNHLGLDCLSLSTILIWGRGEGLYLQTNF